MAAIHLEVVRDTSNSLTCDARRGIKIKPLAKIQRKCQGSPSSTHKPQHTPKPTQTHNPQLYTPT